MPAEGLEGRGHQGAVRLTRPMLVMDTHALNSIASKPGIVCMASYSNSCSQDIVSTKNHPNLARLHLKDLPHALAELKLLAAKGWHAQYNSGYCLIGH